MEDEGRGVRLPTRTALIVAAALATAAVGSGCGTYIGTTASSFLRKARESEDPNIRYLAYQKLASPNCYDTEEQKAEAVRVLVTGLEPNREPTAARAAICQTLGALGRPEARDAILQAIEDEHPVVRAEACRALGKVGRTEDASTLARIMVADTQLDCRIAAIEGLGELKHPDPRIDDLLVDGMESPDPAIRYASLQSLRKISGQDFGIMASAWRKYAQARAAHADPSQPQTAANPAPADPNARR